MRLLVCGGRNYADYARVCEVIKLLAPTVIIHGAARGADSLAARWAHENSVTAEAYPAEWERDGRAAGPIRNKRMLTLGKPDCVLAFPGGRGTAHMVKIARAAGVKVELAS